MLWSMEEFKYLMMKGENNQAKEWCKHSIRDKLRKIDHSLRILLSSERIDEFQTEIMMLSVTIGELMSKLTLQETEFIPLQEIEMKEKSEP